MNETYSILSRPYYNSTKQCYINVLTLDRIPPPNAIISKIIRKTTFNKLSPFKQNTECYSEDRCGITFVNPDDKHKIATNDDIPLIFSWLITNGYKIEPAITQMINIGNIRMSYPIVAFILK